MNVFFSLPNEHKEDYSKKCGKCFSVCGELRNFALGINSQLIYSSPKTPNNMKKVIFSFAIAAMMASCIQQGLSAEGQQAWEKFKELSATFETTTTAYDTYETADEFNAACAAWSEATQAMMPYMLDLTPEQLDSLNKMTDQVGAVVKQIQEEVNAPAEPADEEEADEEAEE